MAPGFLGAGWSIGLGTPPLWPRGRSNDETLGELDCRRSRGDGRGLVPWRGRCSGRPALVVARRVPGRRRAGRPRHRQPGAPQGGRVCGQGVREARAPARRHRRLPPAGRALKSRTIDEAHSRLALVRDGGEEPLTLGEDAIISLRVDPAPSVEAALVFAGYGLSIPEAGHDDFEGLDVRGKLVVYLRGAPPGVPGPLAAHMQSEGERSEALRRAGAIGTVAIPNPKHMDIPWERSALARFLPSMTLADPSLDDNRGLKAGVAFNPAHADKLLAGSGHTFQEILEAADAGKPLPHFAIPAKLKATVAVTRADVASQNVVALLPGTDPALKDEYVVFSAHLDHLGVGKPINGDAIYNGAMDNASGVASLLDVAAMLKESGTKLRRSVLFVAVTGEEKGLLGSKFFANHPTVGRREDRGRHQHRHVPAALPAEAADDLRHRRVGPRRRRRGGRRRRWGSPSSPTRSRSGTSSSAATSTASSGGASPSLMFKVGFAKGSPEEETFKTWLKERYHAPSDDLNQPVDKAAAESFDRFWPSCWSGSPTATIAPAGRTRRSSSGSRRDRVE